MWWHNNLCSCFQWAMNTCVKYLNSLCQTVNVSTQFYLRYLFVADLVKECKSCTQTEYKACVEREGKALVWVDAGVWRLPQPSNNATNRLFTTQEFNWEPVKRYSRLSNKEIMVSLNHLRVYFQPLSFIKGIVYDSIHQKCIIEFKLL